VESGGKGTSGGWVVAELMLPPVRYESVVEGIFATKDPRPPTSSPAPQTIGRLSAQEVQGVAGLVWGSAARMMGLEPRGELLWGRSGVIGRGYLRWRILAITFADKELASLMAVTLVSGFCQDSQSLATDSLKDV
jgi:hypothetical protein